MSKNLLDICRALKDFEGRLRGRVFLLKYHNLIKFLRIDKTLVKDLQELPEELCQIIQDLESVMSLEKDTCNSKFPWEIDFGNIKRFPHCELPKNHDGPHKFSVASLPAGVKFILYWEDVEKEEADINEGKFIL
jgi:hypothetical protein